MLANSFGQHAGGGDVPAAITHAIRVMRAAQPERPPVIVGFLPSYHNNPYQELVYSRAWLHGLAPVPVNRAGEVRHLEAALKLGADVIVHVHWTNMLTQACATKEEARQCIDSFLSDVDDLLERGAKLVWTLHNRLPHECAFVEDEVLLRSTLADRASLIHVMEASAPAAVSDLYDVPAHKVQIVPHPSYRGVYPNAIVPAQARWELSLPADVPIFLMVGGIRPYKNLDLLLDTFDELVRGKSRSKAPRLIVAGQFIGNWYERDQLEERLVRHPYVHARLGRVADRDMQRYLNAADYVTLPYTEILNSGVLHLAAAFNRPVIAPDKGAVGHVVKKYRLGATFEPSDVHRGLLHAMQVAADGNVVQEPSFEQFELDHAYATVSDALSMALSEVARDLRVTAGEGYENEAT